MSSSRTKIAASVEIGPPSKVSKGTLASTPHSTTGTAPPLENAVVDTTTNVDDLTLRKNILVLAATDDWQKGELDRYMIALYRFQTEGRVAYRRIIGMHGGGGGWGGVGWGGDGVTDYKQLLIEKARADFNAGHYTESTYPDNFFWPEPSPNSAEPVQYKAKSSDNSIIIDNPYTYTFCWHAKPQFLLWHRPLMIEMEFGLQDYDLEQHDTFDPNEPETFKYKIKQGSSALG